MEKSNNDTQALLDQRRSTYGDVTDNFTRTAQMWNAYLGTDLITPADAAMMLALYKAYRFKVTPDYSDNIKDFLGYGEIVRQVQEETGGLIDAENVKEYVAKKAELAEPVPTVDDYIALYGTASQRGNLPDSRVEAQKPYSIPQPDQAEGRNMEQYLRNRCAADTGQGPCLQATGHPGYCAAK